MNLVLKGNLILGLLLASLSCEQKEKLNVEVEATVSPQLQPSKAMVGSLVHSEVINQLDLENPDSEKGINISSLLGESLSAEQTDKHAEWIEKLSSNKAQKAHRARQFAHMKRIEIVDWKVSEKHFKSLSGEEGVREIEIPFFAGKKLAVSAKKIHHYSVDTINVAGSLSDDPKVKVNFNISKMKPVGVIEGNERLYYYEYFEGLVILLESEPGSQDPAYNCECEFHRAQQ